MDLALGAAVVGVLAIVAWRVGAIDLLGAIHGFALGFGIWLGLGWPGFAVLALFVVGGSGLTRIGYRRKAARGAAEGRQGRRGARNALANGGVGLFAALLAGLTGQTVFTVAFVGSIAAALADTTESEIGGLVGGKTISPITGKLVPPGTEGAISLEGTLAGLLGAFATAVLAAGLGLIPAVAVAPIAVLALVATFVESLLGSRWALSNELLNAVCTALGALFAATVSQLL